ncbi:MAG: urease accessory protein UreE [Azospirillaceae bacterium]|nr:urease accessory protein UreE [Azospirillaceae bacterium]
MRRATQIRTAGTWALDQAVDRLVLPFDERHRRRFRFTAEHGLDVLLDLDRAVVLNDGDGLVLDDGTVVLVRAAAEPLLEIRGCRAGDLVRFAYHVGNRHLPAQIAADRVLIRFDAVIRDMLAGLGAQLAAVSAPFTPEPGAYDDQGHHDHDHHGSDHHGSDHHDHDHG